MPSLTLSPPSSSLAPADIDEGCGETEVVVTSLREELEAKAVEVDDIDGGDGSDEGGGWQTVNPLAGATQFDFDDSQLPSYEELEEDELSPSALAVIASPPPLPQPSSLPSDGAAVTRPTPPMSSASHFPSLPSNLPSGPVPLYSTTPSPLAEPSPPAAAVPLLNVIGVEAISPSSPPPNEVPYVAESPIHHSPDMAASMSSQPSPTSPPPFPLAPPPLSPPRRPSSQSSPVEFSPSPHSLPMDEEVLSPSAFGPASLHPSLPALEPGTFDAEEEEERLRAVEALDIELDDSPLYNADRPTEGSIAAQRDSQTTKSSPSLPSSLGKRKAGATSAVLSPPSPPSLPITRSAVVGWAAAARPPSPVTASQLLTDSQVSEMVESQTFDGSLYQHAMSTLAFNQYPLHPPTDAQDAPSHATMRPPSSRREPPLQSEGEHDELNDMDNSSVLSGDSPQAALPEDGHLFSYQSVMEVELDSDDGAVGDGEADEGAMAGAAAVAAVKEERDMEEEDEEVEESLDGAFDLRSRASGSGSRLSASPQLQSPTFSASPSPPQDFSPPPPPRPTRPPPSRPRPALEESTVEGKSEIPAPPRTRGCLQGSASGNSPSQRERKRKSGAMEVEDPPLVDPADEKEESVVEERRRSRSTRKGREPAAVAPSSPPRRSVGREERKRQRHEEEEKEEESVDVHCVVEEAELFVSPVGRSTAPVPAKRGSSRTFPRKPSNAPLLTPTPNKLTARERTHRRKATSQQEMPTPQNRTTRWKWRRRSRPERRSAERRAVERMWCQPQRQHPAPPPRDETEGRRAMVA